MIKLTLGALMVVAASMLTYYKSTENAFVWDTLRYLYKHPFYLSSLGPDHIIWMFSSLEVVNWHPLTWLSWAIDYQLYGGLDTWGYHFSNNILHSINGALLFIVALVVFGLNEPGTTGFPLRKQNIAFIAAFMAALLFAVHPQHVESVAWVAERKDLLCQLFMLLSVLAYVKYATCLKDKKKRWFLTCFTLFLLAILSKPMAVTFPVVLLLIDVYPLRRSPLINPLSRLVTQQSFYILLREKLPFFLLSIFSILITLHAQHDAFVDIPFNLRVLNAFNSIVFYLTQLFVPLHFSPHYPYFVGVGEDITWKAFMPLLGVFSISVASIFAWTRGQHAWLVAWLFYLVTLSPVLGLIQVGEQGSADRYTYLPTLPVYILAGAAILTFLEKSTTAKRWLVILPFLPIVFLLANQTKAQIGVWKDPLSLWQHAAKYSPNSHFVQFNLGITNVNLSKFKEAALNFEIAGNLEPVQGNMLAWRGLTYLHLKRYEEALTVLTELRAASKSMPEIRADDNCIKYNLGWISAQLGMLENAVKFFSSIEAQTKLDPAAMIWLSWLENNSELNNKQLTRAELPGFCEATIPALVVNEWSDQVGTNTF